MVDSLQELINSLPPALQWLAVTAAGAVPFIESYFGSVIGILVGLSPPMAVIAAATGNIASMLVLVLGADNVRRRLAGAPDDPSSEALSPRRRRIRTWFHRYGVPGVSLLGQTMLPSQITSAALVSLGAPRRAVICWQIISIVLWGTIFATLATLGADVLGNE